MKAIVLGGSFSGVSAACALADAGYEVTLIDEHSFIGGDVVAAQHTRITCGTGGLRMDMPNGRTKMMLHARLRDHGVQMLLLARCAGILTDGKRGCGAVIATKYGIYAVRSDAVIDATESGKGAYHLTGKRAQVTEAEYGYDMEHAPALMADTVAMPEEMGLTGQRVLLTRTMKPNTINVSFRFPAKLSPGFAGRMDIERRAHSLMAGTALELKKKRYFEEAKVLLTGSHVRLYYDEKPEDERICMISATLSPEFSSDELEKVQKAAENAALDYVSKLTGAGEPKEFFSGGRTIYGWRMEAADEQELMRLSFDAETQEFERMEADVVVVGAGTGGAMAGWALSSHETDVLLLDALYWCGGTNTVGKVYSAWHGYTDGMFAQRYREAAEMPEAGALTPRVGGMLLWEKRFASGSARMLGGFTLCGGIREDGRMKDALVCGENGFALVHGKFFIDGTADGDLCALTGAEYTVGGPRDGFVQTSSMWGFENNVVKDFTLNHYNMDQDVIDPDSYADLLRGIGLGYRGNSEYEIVEMCMQRESRRFKCRKSLTMAGIARRETHEDDIAVGLCIHDTHGRPSSLMNTLELFGARMIEAGAMDIRIRMPLGMFLPCGYDNVAIVGKSMCGEREAVGLCRMNPDISNSAYSVGLVAAYAIRQGTYSLEDVALEPVQEELRALRVLPDWAAKPSDALGIEEAVEALSDAADGGFASMVQKKEDIMPHLLKALAEGGVRADNAAMALAWHGEAQGAPVLLRMLKTEIEKDVQVFERCGEQDIKAMRSDGFEKIVNEDPRYGWVRIAMDDPDFSYSRVNRLLGLIGLAGGEGLEEVIDIAERANACELFRGKTPYAFSRIDTHSLIAEDRIWSIITAAERLADKKAAPALERILNDPDLAGQRIEGILASVTPPKSAFMEIAAARAAAHCGSKAGARLLVGYLSDARSVFRKMAAMALKECFGQEMNETGWKKYIEESSELPVTAYRGDPFGG
ncbi:MAG: FAD-dependent oxidoreductase [Clostridia bacterium]|nr:FAD-dependent oxidoreductase [Clostridia bacterium]